MHEFLKKLAPEVEWLRCFPAVSKPAPKIGRLHAAPQNRHAGATGTRLVEEMLLLLQKHYRGAACSLDFVLLIDDADCRFADAADSSAEQTSWEGAIGQRVRDAVDKQDLAFFSLLAWPEIESWLLTDWENSFGTQYRQVATLLRQHITDCILHPLVWNHVERFGGRRRNGTCEHKLSVRLQEAFSDKTGCGCLPPFLDRVKPPPEGAVLAYSKRIDGAAMLKRILPERVLKDCPRFRAAYHLIRKEASKDPSVAPPLTENAGSQHPALSGWQLPDEVSAQVLKFPRER